MTAATTPNDDREDEGADGDRRDRRSRWAASAAAAAGSWDTPCHAMLFGYAPFDGFSPIPLPDRRSWRPSTLGVDMLSTMQDFPLTVTGILRHGTGWNSSRRVTTATPDGYRDISFGELGTRVAQLAHGLRQLGVSDGDRVATFMWNNQEHLEAYFAAPCMGAVLHTLNIRLAGEQIAFIANQAEDRVVLVDMSLVPLLAAVLPEMTSVQTVVAVGEGDVAPLAASGKTVIRYDDLLDGQPIEFDWPDLDERSAAAMCYTSGTTGNPKGVVYSHRSSYLHSMSICAANCIGSGRRRPRVTDRADVPRERVGNAVRGRDGRRRPADARPVPAGRPAGRHDRTAPSHRRRRRSDHLERRIAVPARPSRSRHLVAATGGLRGLGRSAGDDEGPTSSPTACASSRAGA